MALALGMEDFGQVRLFPYFYRHNGQNKNMSDIKILNAIRQRRSIRTYDRERSLEPEQVQIIMEAGLRAPSSKGKHTTQFILVDDREMLVRLSYMRESGSAFLRNVPLGVVVLGSPMECDAWMADASLAAGYMQLQAQALGLGSCWAQVEGRNTPSGQDSAEYVRQALEIPYQLEVLCILGIGYPVDKAPERPIESLRWEQIHLGRYALPEEAEAE